jgi:hypothetical protein
MKICVKILFLIFLIGQGSSSAQSLDFFKTMGGTGDDGAYDLVVDLDRNIYLLGWYTGVVDLDPGPGASNVSGFGNRDIFLAKYDSVGNHIWSFGIGGTGHDEGGDIAVDGAGNILISGRFSTSIDFDPGIGMNVKASTGDRDIYLAKYSPAGALLWVNTMGGVGYDDTEDMVVDATGNIYIAGSFQFTVDFNPGTGISTRVSSGLDDAYMACYSASGIFNWVKSFGGNGIDDFGGIQLDGSGFVYGVGLFSGTPDFDGGIGVYNVTSLGLSDVFIVKYDVLGNFHDVVTFGGIGADAAYGLELFNDLVYVTGSYSNGVDFDPGFLLAIKNSLGSGDIFLCQFDSLLNYNWVNSAGGVGFDLGVDVSVDSYGGVISTGLFRANSLFQGGLGSKNLIAMGDRDIFVEFFDASGNLKNVFPIGSVGVDNVNAFYYDKISNALFIPGFIGGVADFDPDINSTTPMNFSGVTDIFYAKYYFCDSVATINEILGDSVLCEGDTIYYAIDSLALCENCIWTFPTGSSLIDSTGADVLFVAGDQSGLLTVYKANTCLESDTVRLFITIKNRPLSYVSDSLCMGSIYTFPDGTTGTTDTVQTIFNGSFGV